MSFLLEINTVEIKGDEDYDSSTFRGAFEEKGVVSLGNILALIESEITKEQKGKFNIEIEVSGELKQAVNASGKIFGVLSLGGDLDKTKQFKITLKGKG